MKKIILIIGYGNIAQRHILNIKKIYPDSYIDVLRNKNKIEDNKNIRRFFFNKKHVNKNIYQYVFICSNTHTHFEYLKYFAKTNAKIFVEKPLLNKSNEIRKTQSFEKKYKNQITVGYVLRFHPIIQKLKSLLNNNVVGEILDIEIFSTSFVKFWNKSNKTIPSYLDPQKGGGAINELSHEIDLIFYLFKSLKVNNVFEIKKIFNTRVEEGFKLFGEIKKNQKIFLNINFNSLENRRTILIKGTKGQLMSDLLSNQITFLNHKTLHYKKYFKIEDRNLRYLREIKFFFNKKTSTISTSHLCTYDEAIKISQYIDYIKSIIKK